MDTIQNLRRVTRVPRQRNCWKHAVTLTTCAECEWVKSCRCNAGVNSRMLEKFPAKTTEHSIKRCQLIGGRCFGQEFVSKTLFEGIQIDFALRSMTRSVNLNSPTLPCSQQNGQDWPFVEDGNWKYSCGTNWSGGNLHKNDCHHFPFGACGLGLRESSGSEGD